MKPKEYFKRLEVEFGLTPHDFCKARGLGYATLKKCLDGHEPSPSFAKKIEDATRKKVLIKEIISK